MQLSTMILFATVIMATYFIEGIIGFDGTILALPLASMVLKNNMTTIVIVLTIIVLFASIFIIIGLSIIFVLLAIYVSNIVHKKIKSDSFTKFVYTALCFSGFLIAA